MSVDNNSEVRSNHPLLGRAYSSFIYFIKRLTARKSMSQIQTEIDTHNELKRTLNWVLLTGIGLGAIIGMGIFTLSGQAAALYAGPSVIISFIITGIVALLATLSFSEMAAMMASSGSVYTYTYAALGEYAAWFIGWNMALFHQLGALTVIVGWSKYVVLFISHASGKNVTSWAVQSPLIWNEGTETFVVTGQAINIPAIMLTIAITVLLVIGIRATAIVTLVLVVIKLIILFIFIIACSSSVDPKNYSPFFPPNEGSFSEYGVTGMFQACTYVFFAYVGFDAIAAVAQEAKSPSRSLPVATIASVVISMLLYIAICTVMVGLVPYSLLDVDSPLSVAVQATSHGLWLQLIVDFGAIAGLATVAIANLLAQNRIFYAMAHDGLLPPVFAKIHPHTKTPWISIIISGSYSFIVSRGSKTAIILGTFCAVFSGLLPVDIVGDTSSLSALITYIFVHISVVVMRYTHRNEIRNFPIPFGAWLIPVVGSLLCILMMKGISNATGFRFLAWTALGQFFYLSYGFWHSKQRRSLLPELRNNEDELETIPEETTTQSLDNGSDLDSVIGTKESNA